MTNLIYELKKCKECSCSTCASCHKSVCHHTTNIHYAANFEDLGDGLYMEKE